MSTRRKISVRRVMQTLVTLVAVAGCVLALMSADRVHTKRRVKDIQIHIRNSNAVQFVSDSDVRKALFSNRHIDPKKLTLANVDIHTLESIARSNPWVSDAQAYVDNNQVVHILLTQRVPVVRIFQSDGDSYYLDTALQAMPLSGQYVHYTTVISNTPVLRNDSIGRITKGTLVWLSKYIASHPLWNAQFAQVAMTDNNSFVLIPVIGKQRILIGDTSRLDDKMRNLLSFYKQVQNKLGWDRYRTIDLRFVDQVVASPSIPWKVPPDKGLSNIAWVKAIMDAVPKDKNEANPDTLAIQAPAEGMAPPVSAKRSQKQAVRTNNTKADAATQRNTVPPASSKDIPKHHIPSVAKPANKDNHN